MMAVVNFGGSLVIRQNFTASATLLKAAVSGSGAEHRDEWPIIPAGNGGHRGNAFDQHCRSRLWRPVHAASIRSLAKNLREVRAGKC